MAFEDLHRPLSAAGFRGVVRFMVIASGVCFIFQQITGGWFTQQFGLVPVDVWQNGKVWQLFTYPFLHGGVFHWLFNMLIFWMFGRELEIRWGTWRFVRFCLLTALGAAACVLFIIPTSNIPTIGSSGIGFGLLVAFAVTFPHSTMYLYFLIPMKTWQAAALFGIIELLTAFNSSQGPGPWAHLGGMITALLYFYLPRLRYVSFRMPKMGREKSPELFVVTDSLATEVDRILDKVAREGAGRLTAQEKEIMDRYAQRKKRDA